MTHYRVIRITDCRDCPYARDHKGHGECWKECWHPDEKGDTYGIIWGCRESFTKIPKWCPFGLGINHAP